MSLQNRWGDNVEKDGGGLLGPDGQPLAPSPKTPKEEDAAQPAAEPQLDFLITSPALVFKP